MTLIKHLRKIGFIISILLIIYFVNPYNLNVYIGYLVFVWTLLQRNFLIRNLDPDVVLLFLFSITYAMFFAFDAKSGKQYILVYAMVPVSFYLIGRYASMALKEQPKKLYFLIFFAATLISLTPILSVTTNILSVGFSEVDRNLPNFWTGQIISATIMGSYFSLNMCIPALLLVGRNKSNWFFQVFAILLFVLSIACVLRIGSRTQLGIFLITFLMSLIYIVPRQSVKKNVSTIIIFGLLLFIIISNVNFDFDQDWLSAFAGRMEDGGADDIASGGGRTERWVKSFENLFEKPLGWDASEFGHAHNMWLDVLRIAGFIPFILLSFFSIKCFILLRKAIGKSKKELAFNNQITVYFFALTMVFTVEPIFEGMFDLFAFFCFFIGVVYKYRTAHLIITET